MFESFKLWKIPQFPFVVIPPNVSIETIREKAPFLLLCILTTCSVDNVELHTKLCDRAKEIVSKRVVLDGERTLELIQGLLVYCGYVHYQLVRAQQLYMFRQILSQLVSDMGLDRPPGKDPTLMLKHQNTGCGAINGYEGAPADVRRIGKRAFLGSYYLMCASAIFRRTTFVVKHTK